ncbi:ABC transporter ATP-binding protein [Paenibacillus sedimenti]|nr:ABC transporter ATP-binding protein [Paenibacillus sedimenti]
MYDRDKGIKNINLSVNEHEIHGLIGMNGAGKTSIIKAMLLQMLIDEGTISWQGNVINMKDEVSYRKRIGYVPDDEVLLDHLTPYEIIEFTGFAYEMTKDKIRQNAEGLFQVLQLSELHMNVGGFSRGMRKKVQLAAALLSNPKLLILDEPIAGFDPQVIYMIKQLLREWKLKGNGVLISTHDMGFAEQLCDRVTLIHRGEVLLSGSVSGMLAEHGCQSLEELFISLTLMPSAKELVKDVVANL